MKCFSVFFPRALSLILLVGCSAVPEAPLKESQKHAEHISSAPIQFTNLKIDIPLGADIGKYRGGMLGLFYVGVGDEVLHLPKSTTIYETFTNTLQKQGYDVVNVLRADFEEEFMDEYFRSEYKVSARIIDANIDALYKKKGGVFFEIPTSRTKGDLYLKIKWSLYDNLQKKTVYRTITEGSATISHANEDGMEMMISRAFSAAAHNFGADKHVHDLLFYGVKPPFKELEKQTERPRHFDPNETLTLKQSALSQAPLIEHIERTRQVAVRVQAGAGHGSGFFITHSGHILSNQHVTGNARHVRITTADKKHTAIAEVLRTDPVRDVALLKLIEIPEGLEIITLPIQTAWPKVSAEIYALGTPAKSNMQDTLTKGIVSAHRRNLKVFNIPQNFIQGDVQIIGGNSGGCLLDARGNIIGIAVAGILTYNPDSNTGLNLFIPIEEALNALSIDLL